MKQQAFLFEKTKTRRVRFPYLVHVPEGGEHPLEERLPLIFFLHGVAERGEDLSTLSKHGIPKIVEERREFPFITVSPQCPGDTWWPNEIDVLDGLLDEVLRRLPVDEDRVSLTGLSMGGFGAWHWGSESPERFAAVVPICGGGHWAYGFPEKVRALHKTPVWAFHGARDPVIPLFESEILVRALQDQESGAEVRFTVYPEAEHDCWTETYQSEELYRWLLAQRRKERGTLY